MIDKYLSPSEIWVVCPDCGRRRAFNKKQVENHRKAGGTDLCKYCARAKRDPSDFGKKPKYPEASG